jgi:hypothetical protein
LLQPDFIQYSYRRETGGKVQQFKHNMYAVTDIGIQQRADSEYFIIINNADANQNIFSPKILVNKICCYSIFRYAPLAPLFLSLFPVAPTWSIGHL